MKQGLNVEARNVYLHVAELCSRAGRRSESLEAYEKIAEIDPQNHAVHLKLAEMHLSEGARGKAHANFAGAARAQVKGGDLQGALVSFRRAIHLDPLDVDVMQGFLDACIQAGDVSPALEQLRNSLATVPDHVMLHRLLGQACMANKDFEGALAALQFALGHDDSSYLDFIPMCRAFLEAGDPDQAATCLDAVIPILITKRETDKAVEAYNLILDSYPTHILTLTKLAGIYSATNDTTRHLDVLDRIAGSYLSQQSPREALEYLDKILSLAPTSEKHIKLHREAFAEAFPDSPYTPPVAIRESGRRGAAPGAAPPGERDLGPSSSESSNPAVVEVDLLLNYGMRDKAVAMLQSLVVQDPSDKEIRTRLLNIYKDDQNWARAAEECVLLAALHRAANNEEAALKCLAEARKCAPDMVTPQFDVAAFARKHGIVVESGAAAAAPPGANMEVDLSGDLSDMFFKETADAEIPVEGEAPEIEHAGTEFMPELPLKAPSESVQEQLQEVDFYIRLGFFDEARAKLDEIARAHQDHPELPSRYDQLSGLEAAKAETPAAPAAGGTRAQAAPAPSEQDLSQELRVDRDLVRFAESFSAGADAEPAAEARVRSDAAKAEQPPAPKLQEAPADRPVNTMFADLLEEVNALTDREIAREEFDTHFSLGIAYREMELIEDAIKEFQGAYKALNPAKFPKEAIQCCGMLSTCFLEKGMPRSAIRWCQAGIGVSGISAHEDLALRYDMGLAHSMLGDSEQALECFDHIYAVDPSYRDVAQKIDSLRRGPDRHAP
jgi:tetratricopeptide (TPR) repeat protein